MTYCILTFVLRSLQHVQQSCCICQGLARSEDCFLTFSSPSSVYAWSQTDHIRLAYVPFSCIWQMSRTVVIWTCIFSKSMLEFKIKGQVFWQCKCLDVQNSSTYCCTAVKNRAMVVHWSDVMMLNSSWQSAWLADSYQAKHYEYQFWNEQIKHLCVSLRHPWRNERLCCLHAFLYVKWGRALQKSLLVAKFNKLFSSPLALVIQTHLAVNPHLVPAKPFSSVS